MQMNKTRFLPSRDNGDRERNNLPDFSLRTPRVGDKVGAGTQSLGGPTRQDRGCIFLVAQVLALQHVLGVLPEQVTRHWRHVDHPVEARRGPWARLVGGCPLL